MVCFNCDFFWVCASPFDDVFEGHYFTCLGLSSRLSLVFGSSVFKVLRSSLSSFIGIFSALSVICPSNSGSAHLPMSSSSLAAGVSSPVSSASKMQSSRRFVAMVRALTLTFVVKRLPALASRIRFLNWVATSVEPLTLIMASESMSMPSRLTHLSRSLSWVFGGAISKVSHSNGVGPTVIPGPVWGASIFPHLHGHERQFLHKCPLGSVSSRLAASSGSSSWLSELIIARVGGFSGACNLFCWISIHVPRFTPSMMVCSNRDWLAGRTIPVFL